MSASFGGTGRHNNKRRGDVIAAAFESSNAVNIAQRSKGHGLTLDIQQLSTVGLFSGPSG